MAGSMLDIRGWIMRLWHNRLRRKWRKLRAGTLRRLGLLPPATGPLPDRIDFTLVGATDGPHPEPIFETSLRPDPEALSVWYNLLPERPGDAPPLGGKVRRPNVVSNCALRSQDSYTVASD